MEGLSLLIVGGHPADVFDCAGGTLAHHVEAGDRVTALCLTHGARSHSIELIDDVREGRRAMQEATDEVVAEFVDVKRQEVIDACAIMGIKDVRFLEYEDDVPLLNERLIIRIDETIREVKPDIMITHYPVANAGEPAAHVVCGRAAMAAMESASGMRRGATLPPHRVAQVFFMGVAVAGFARDVLYSLYPVFCPIVVDVTDTVERKVRALDKLRSQKYHGLYARKRMEVVDGNYGYYVRVAYGEPFIAFYPEVSRRLPVSDFLRNRARENAEEETARYCQILTPHLPPVFEE